MEAWNDAEEVAVQSLAVLDTGRPVRHDIIDITPEKCREVAEELRRDNQHDTVMTSIKQQFAHLLGRKDLLVECQII